MGTQFGEYGVVFPRTMWNHVGKLEASTPKHADGLQHARTIRRMKTKPSCVASWVVFEISLPLDRTELSPPSNKVCNDGGVLIGFISAASSEVHIA